ncbi:MAG: helix-turn-helix transcriptional regulator [Chloroflexi bacterium]|nr:helix-turn-helix transcriptional regulator [Chloroflexota bacterium]
MDERLPVDEPAYVISVAARLVSLHPQTLRYYERLGLVKPTRTEGRIRLYSRRNIETLRKIARLTDDLGVNLAGVEVIMNMTQRVAELQQELDAQRESAKQEIERLHRRIQYLEEILGSALPQPVINVSATEVPPTEQMGGQGKGRRER